MSAAILTQGLTRRFGDLEAVRDLDLRVPEGCVYGFLGPNGAGKTTTIRLLLGLLKPTSGVVRLNGIELHGQPGRALSSLGAIVDTPGLYPNLSGRENLQLAVLSHGGSAQEIPDLARLVDLEHVLLSGFVGGLLVLVLGGYWLGRRDWH